MAIATIGLSGPALGQVSVEADDVKFFVLETRTVEGRSVLHMEGLVFHSSLGVRQINASYDGEVAVVEVLLSPAGPGISGNIIYDLALTPAIKRVVFGPSRKQIWPVSSG